MALFRARRGRTEHEPDGSGGAVGGPPPAVVSVVVPVYQAEAYLDECLDSARAQTYPYLQLVVVDDGSTDGGPAIIARHAEADPRIVVHRQENAGLGAARNAGIARATGEYLTFLDADDTVPGDAFARMVASLEDSGSDFAIGSVQRVTGSTYRTPRWSVDVHERDRRGVTIDEVPLAMYDVIACNRLFRREFWDRASLRFPEGVAYEDHLPMVTAYVRASRFDLLEATTYHWRIRDDGSSLGQQKHRLDNLRDRLAAKDAAWEVLRAEASPVVQRAWRVRVLDMDLPLFVEHLPGADDDYARLLTDGVRRHLDAADAETLGEVRAERRVQELLLAQGRRSDVEGILAAEAAGGPVPHVSLADGAVWAEYPDLDVPRDQRRLTGRQTRLRAVLRRCVWRSPGVLDVDLAAFVPYVDLTARPADVTAWWVDDDGVEVAAAVVPYADPEITRAEEPTGARYDDAGVRTVWDVSSLPSSSGRARAWHLEVRVEVEGVVRRDVVRHRDGRGSAGALRGCVLADGTRVTVEHERARGLVVTVQPLAPTLARVEVVRGAVRVVASTHGAQTRRLVLAARGRVGQAGSDVTVHGSQVEVRLPLDRVRSCSPEGRWTLRAILADGKAPLGWPVDAADQELLEVPGDAGLRLRRTDAATAVLEVATPLVVASATLDERGPVLDVRRWHLPDGAVAVDLVGAGGAPVRLVADGSGRWRLPDGLGSPAGAGEWRLRVGDAAGHEVAVLVAADTLARLPVVATVGDGDPWRTVLVRTRGSGLGVVREPRTWTPDDHVD